MGLLDMLTDKIQAGFIEANSRAKRFLTDIRTPPKKVVPHPFLMAMNRRGGNQELDFARRVQDQERITGTMTGFREDPKIPPKVRQTIPRYQPPGQPLSPEEQARVASLQVVEPQVAQPVAAPSRVQGIRQLFKQPQAVAAQPIATTRPMENNNPFNIKVGGSNFARENAVGADDQSHLRFQDFNTGIKAGAIDIFLKLQGQSQHPALQKPGATIADLNTVYAEDPNWKNNVSSIASRLMGIPIDINTPIENIPPSIMIEAIGLAEGGLKGFNAQELESIRGIIDETIQSLQ